MSKERNHLYLPHKGLMGIKHPMGFSHDSMRTLVSLYFDFIRILKALEGSRESQGILGSQDDVEKLDVL